MAAAVRLVGLAATLLAGVSLFEVKKALLQQEKKAAATTVLKAAPKPSASASAGPSASASASAAPPKPVKAPPVVKPPPLLPIPLGGFCTTSGVVEPRTQGFHIDVFGVRGTVAGDASRDGQIAFTYLGPSKTDVPLGNGEMRRQIGLKLRAQDTCNIVYVMWHIEPKPELAVSVKRNPGQSKHVECLDRGYTSVTPTSAAPPPPITVGGRHTLRATLDGRALRVLADGALVWEGTLPEEALTFDGPVGMRSDNGAFDVELAVPGGPRPGGKCVGPAYVRD